MESKVYDKLRCWRLEIQHRELQLILNKVELKTEPPYRPLREIVDISEGEASSSLSIRCTGGRTSPVLPQILSGLLQNSGLVLLQLQLSS